MDITYNLNETDIKKIVGFVIIKCLMAMMTKEADGMSPDVLLPETVEFVKTLKGE